MDSLAASVDVVAGLVEYFRDSLGEVNAPTVVEWITSVTKPMLILASFYLGEPEREKWFEERRAQSKDRLTNVGEEIAAAAARFLAELDEGRRDEE